MANRVSEALQWATDDVRRNTHNLKPGGPTDEVAERYTALLRGGARLEDLIYPVELGLDRWGSPDKGLEEWVADLARAARAGKKLGGAISFEVAARLIEEGRPLPKELREFIVEHLRKPDKRNLRGRGRNADDLVWRNSWICTMIAQIHLKWGFPATRNEATKEKQKQDSAASIVQRALEDGAGIPLTEEAINKIWGTSEFGAALGGAIKRLSARRKQIR